MAESFPFFVRVLNDQQDPNVSTSGTRNFRFSLPTQSKRPGNEALDPVLGALPLTHSAMVDLKIFDSSWKTASSSDLGFTVFGVGLDFSGVLGAEFPLDSSKAEAFLFEPADAEVFAGNMARRCVYGRRVV